MSTLMTPEARMRRVFEALSRDDMDALISHWAEDGIYYNPAVGPAAHGKMQVKETIAAMSRRLQERGETLVIDRVTQVVDAAPQRAYVEWHVESTNPQSERAGKLGVHTVLFNSDGLLHRVNVFVHG